MSVKPLWISCSVALHTEVYLTKIPNLETLMIGNRLGVPVCVYVGVSGLVWHVGIKDN